MVSDLFLSKRFIIRGLVIIIDSRYSNLNKNNNNLKAEG